MGINAIVYGVTGSAEDIKKDYEAYEAGELTEDQIKSKYNIDDIATFENAYENASMTYEE
jgi:hypothetical protein